MKYIGVDPGVEGAVAVVDEGEVISVERFKTITIKVGKKNRSSYDVAALLAQFRSLREAFGNSMVFIEQVTSRRKQGVVSMFSMGRGAGLLEMAIASCGFPYQYVTPQAWKKKLMAGFSGGDKDESCIVVNRLFPVAMPLIAKPRKGYDHNKADAILIAEYGRQLRA